MAVDALPGQDNNIGTTLNRMSGVQTEKNLYAPKNKMDKEAFLKMFVEQMKHQDPLNPTTNEQFGAQMAMFSQLEQQMNMNTKLDKMLQQGQNAQIAALQLVGKEISADKAAIYHDPEKHSGFNFNIPEDASDVKVEVLNVNGEKVKLLSLGAQNKGTVAAKWDGMNEEGRPSEGGRYTFKVLAKTMDNKDMPVASKVEGRVTGVTSDKGVTFLLVGDQRVGLSDVETVREAGSVKKEGASLVPGMTNAMGPAKDEKAADKKPSNMPTIAVEGEKNENREAKPVEAAENSAGTGSEPRLGDEEDSSRIHDGRGKGSVSDNHYMDALMPIFFR